MDQLEINGVVIRPWTSDQLITIAPLLGELVKIVSSTPDPVDIGLKIFAEAPRIIGLSLDIDAETVKKWESGMVGAVLMGIFEVNSHYFEKLSSKIDTAIGSKASA